MKTDIYKFFCDTCTQNEEYREANCLNNCELRHYKKGDIIINCSENSRKLYFINSGTVTIELILKSGAFLKARTQTAPYIIGSNTLFSKERNHCISVIAKKDCYVFIINKNDVEEQMSKCSIFMSRVIHDSTNKFDLLLDHVFILLQRSIKSKLASYLLTISNSEDKFTFEYSNEDIACYLAIERPSLSRTLRQLVNEGIITYSRGNGEILNKHALKMLIE